MPSGKRKSSSRYAAEQGHTVLCPHLLYPQFLDDNDKEERELGIKAGLEMLKDADEVWVPSWKVSEGMDDQYVLECFYMSGESDIEKISDYFGIERTSAYKKKNRALDRLVVKLYGKE